MTSILVSIPIITCLVKCGMKLRCRCGMKLRCSRWSLGMSKQFQPTLYDGWNYLSMLGIKLIHVSERGPRQKWLPACRVLWLKRSTSRLRKARFHWSYLDYPFSSVWDNDYRYVAYFVHTIYLIRHQSYVSLKSVIVVEIFWTRAHVVKYILRGYVCDWM